MYDIGLYDASAPDHKLGMYTRVVNRGNYRSVIYDGCVGVPLPIITRKDMKPVFIPNKGKLETFFETYGIDVYESKRYHDMAQMIIRNGAIPYMMPYPMETGAEVVPAHDIYGGNSQVSMRLKFVGGVDYSKRDLERADFLNLLNGAVVSVSYKKSKITVSLVDRNGDKIDFSGLSDDVGVGGKINKKITIGHKVNESIELKYECKGEIHLKQQFANTIKFMLGGGAFDKNYDNCTLETGSYNCTLLTGTITQLNEPVVSHLMYPGYGSASSTVWYVLTVADSGDEEKANYDITFAKYDASNSNQTTTIKTVKGYSKAELTWTKFITDNIIPGLSCGKSLEGVTVAKGTYVFTARGVIGGYENWINSWVDQLKNAPAFVATQVCVDWKYFTNDDNKRNDVLKEFEKAVLDKYRSENINTMLVVDEDLLKANYDTDSKSISDEHLVVCKFRNSTESELLTCAVAARLSASGCETATASQLELSDLKDPSSLVMYDSAKLKQYSEKGVLCIHKVIGISNPVIYHDVTGYRASDLSEEVNFVHTRGYAVRTLAKLIYDIGVMYNSQYVGRIRNNNVDLLKSDVYDICKKYGESNYIMLMDIQDIEIDADSIKESVKISLPIQITPYVETVLLTISI